MPSNLATERYNELLDRVQEMLRRLEFESGPNGIYDLGDLPIRAEYFVKLLGLPFPPFERLGYHRDATNDSDHGPVVAGVALQGNTRPFLDCLLRENTKIIHAFGYRPHDPFSPNAVGKGDFILNTVEECEDPDRPKMIGRDWPAGFAAAYPVFVKTLKAWESYIRNQLRKLAMRDEELGAVRASPASPSLSLKPPSVSPAPHEESEAPAQTRLSEPSQNAFKAYTLCKFGGMTQRQAAEKMQEELRVPVSQGQVCRWIKCVSKLLAQGYPLPGLYTDDSKPPTHSVDPAKLERGKRTDGRKGRRKLS